jgi:hypothetical protein
VVFARSNRSMFVFAMAALGTTLVLGGWGVAMFVIGARAAALVLFMLAAVALAVVVRTALRLRRWPVSRLGFFRDRFVLVQGRTELQVPWEHVLTATLADQGDWSASRWPELSLTDRLTVRLKPARRFSFRPATFGLEPAACRDLILRLRDEPSLRLRLPEFDSVLDLKSGHLHTGEFIRPTL